MLVLVQQHRARLDVSGDFRLGTVAGGATILNEIVKVTCRRNYPANTCKWNGGSFTLTIPGANTGNGIVITNPPYRLWNNYRICQGNWGGRGNYLV
ncbi:MAG: hypothetical protein IPL50_17955 [Chitinophagaceae bacterium]|nr:hypothetical protein [Chitinophagaceae bacterium]